MDTAGREKDIRNMEMIVNAASSYLLVLWVGYSARNFLVFLCAQAKTESSLHGVVMAMSESNPRFDSPMQSELSAGPSYLHPVATLIPPSLQTR
jgi:hypothetical protein